MWTAEASETVRNLWKSGWTASLIADKLSVTRNAVVGKLHRMKLSNTDRPKEIVVRKNAAKKKPEKKRLFRSVPEDDTLISDPDRIHPNDAAIPVHQRLKTLELTSGKCKFPVGVPGEESFFHCGADTIGLHVYCEDHCSRSYKPPLPMSEEEFW